ncbi:MAG: hypothetical protein KBC11_01475 [Candidatus Pacebacteria bacterium]|nr:hypothetical protein [Candidatus Paceibacterota bacterium]
MTNNIPYSPQHGDSLSTKKGNLLICVKKPNNPGKHYFYMDSKGNYLVCEYTKKTGLLPNKTEWNFLFSQTNKVTQLTNEQLSVAEDLIAYIIQDHIYPWKITEVRENMAQLAKFEPGRNVGTFANIPGLAKVAEKFAKTGS